MSLLRRARKNIAMKFATEAVIRLLALFFVIVVARTLGDQDYGKYSLMIYLGGFLTIPADLGLNTLLIREVSRDRQRLASFAGNILTLRLLLSAGVILLSLVLLPFMGYSREMYLLLILGVFSLLCNHLVEFFGAITNSLERFEYELLIKSLNKVLTVLLGLLALWLGLGLWGLAIALLVSHFGSCLLNGGIIRRNVTPLGLGRDFPLWKQLIRSALPIGLALVFITAYVRLDIILLSLLRSDTAEIGWYSVPVKIIEALSIFPYLIMAGLFPIFSSMSREEPERLGEGYQKALVYLVIIALPLVLLIFHLADPWLVILFGPLFQNSILSLRLIIWAVPLIFMHYALSIVLLALNRERLIILGSGLALLFNLVSNLAVLPRYGYLGASVTTVVTELLLVGFYLGHLQRSVYRLPLWSRFVRLALCGGLMALSLHWLALLPLGIKGVLSIIVYGGALFLFRLLVWEDLALVKRIFSHPAFSSTKV
ncbi:MAG: flippase [Deltaproteobacteria bacterium]|nr:flippase [Deltaproteobacteria bacterium]